MNILRVLPKGLYFLVLLTITANFKAFGVQTSWSVGYSFHSTNDSELYDGFVSSLMRYDRSIKFPQDMEKIVDCFNSVQAFWNWYSEQIVEGELSNYQEAGNIKYLVESYYLWLGTLIEKLNGKIPSSTREEQYNFLEVLDTLKKLVEYPVFFTNWDEHKYWQSIYPATQEFQLYFKVSGPEYKKNLIDYIGESKKYIEGVLTYGRSQDQIIRAKYKVNIRGAHQKINVSTSSLTTQVNHQGMLYVEIEGGKPSKIQPIVIVAADTSGSMEGRRLEKLKEALDQLITSLPDGTDLRMFEFNNSCVTIGKRDQTKLCPTLREDLRRSVQSLRATGGTNFFASINQVCTELKGINQCNKLPVTTLFLTDGQVDSQRALESEWAKLKGEDVHLVGIGRDIESAYLSEVAQKHLKGLFHFIPDSENLMSMQVNNSKDSKPKNSLKMLSELLSSRQNDISANNIIVSMTINDANNATRFRSVERFSYELGNDGKTIDILIPSIAEGEKISFLVLLDSKASMENVSTSVAIRSSDEKESKPTDSSIIRLNEDIEQVKPIQMAKEREKLLADIRQAVITSANLKDLLAKIQNIFDAPSNKSLNEATQRILEALNKLLNLAKGVVKDDDFSQFKAMILNLANAHWAERPSLDPSSIELYGSSEQKSLLARLLEGVRRNTKVDSKTFQLHGAIADQLKKKNHPTDR